MKSKPKKGLPMMMAVEQNLQSGRDLRREEARKAAEMKRIMDEVANGSPFAPSEVDKKAAQLRMEAARRIAKNGLTVKDLEEAHQRGFDEGFKKSADNIVRGCYAGVCLALNDLYGFGSKRCCDVLNKLDWHMLYSLTSADAIQEVWDRMKLHIDFKEAFDRITVED